MNSADIYPLNLQKIDSQPQFQSPETCYTQTNTETHTLNQKEKEEIYPVAYTPCPCHQWNEKLGQRSPDAEPMCSCDTFLGKLAMTQPELLQMKALLPWHGK